MAAIVLASGLDLMNMDLMTCTWTHPIETHAIQMEQMELCGMLITPSNSEMNQCLVGIE